MARGTESSRGSETECRFWLIPSTQRKAHPADGSLTANQMEGKDDDKTDVLLNAARALVGACGKGKAMADAFAEWVARPNGGQEVVGGFAAMRWCFIRELLQEIRMEFEL